MMQYFFYFDIIYYLGMLRPNTGEEKLDLLFLAMCVLIACKRKQMVRNMLIIYTFCIAFRHIK